MSVAIWKEPLSSGPVQRLRLPLFSRVIHAEVQAGTPTVWFVCDPADDRTERTFLLLPTGGPYGAADDPVWESLLSPEKTPRVATFFSVARALVWHFFEIDALTAGAEEQVKRDLRDAGWMA